MISVISFVVKFSSFCEKYSEKRILFHKFPFFLKKMIRQKKNKNSKISPQQWKGA
jgi:hypothetical protein